MFLRGFSTDEISRLEAFLIKRLRGEITAHAFMEALDRPYKDGGVGLWSQRAVKVTKAVEEIVEERKVVEDIYAELAQNPTAPLIEEVQKVQEWLLSGYRGKLSDVQKVRLRETVSERLRNLEDKVELMIEVM